MLYNYNEIIKKYKNDYNLRKVIDTKKIYKLSKGIYSDVKDVNRLAIILKKYPNVVITLDSALYTYSLTTKQPSQFFLATLRNYTRIREKDVKQVFNTNIELDYNSLHYVCDDLTVNVFSRERLLIEFFRNIKKYSKDYIDEVLFNFKKCADFLDYDLVLNYAKKYKISLAVEFAIKYIHNHNYFVDYFDDKNKTTVFASQIKGDLFSSSDDYEFECKCCGNSFVSKNSWEYVCPICGWWEDDYTDEDNISYKNHKSLIDYRNHFLYLKKLNKDYMWEKDRNRVPIYHISSIFESEKNICLCCGKDGINKWFDQCEFCGWIADYVQENKDFEDGPNILEMYEYKRKYDGIRRKIKNYKWSNYKEEWKHWIKADKYIEYIKLYDIKYL